MSSEAKNWTIEPVDLDNDIDRTQLLFVRLALAAAKNYSVYTAGNGLMGAVLHAHYLWGISPETVQTILRDLADGVPKMWAEMDENNKSARRSVH